MFPRRTTLLLLLAIILLSIAIRYPTVQHERFQTDSYFIHSLSDDIVRNGQASWTFSPLSYVGYYPFSYPSGVPFLLAELSLLTGLSVEICVLLGDALLATLFGLVVFCLSREFVHRVEFAVLAALVVSIAPRFVDTTYWDGSARGMEVVLLTLLAMVGFRASFFRNNWLLVVMGFIGVGCFVVHHMAVLVILYGAGFVMSVLTARYLPRVFMKRGKRLAIIGVTLLLVSLTIVVLNYFGVLGNSLESIGETGFFSIDIPVLGVIANLMVSYAHQIGPVIVIAAIGVVSLLRAPRFFARGIFPLMILIAFVPVLGSSLYVSMLIAPFIAVIAVSWLQRARDMKKLGTRAFQISLALLLVLSTVFTVWSVDRWNRVEQPTGDTVLVGDAVFNDAAYLNSNGAGLYAISNSETLQSQLEAYSRSRFIGVGVFAAMAGDITEEDIRENVSFSEVPFPGNLYTWYVYKNEQQLREHIFALMLNGMIGISGNTDVREFAAKHSRLLIVLDNNWPIDYATTYGPYHSKLMNELRTNQTASGIDGFRSYCLYESQRTTTFMVQLPT